MSGAVSSGQQVYGAGGFGAEAGGDGRSVLRLHLAGVDHEGEQVRGRLVRRMRNGKERALNSALEKAPAVEEVEPAPLQGGEQVEVRLGIGLPVRQVKGQGGELGAIVEAEAGFPGGSQQRLFRAPELVWRHQHVNVIGREAGQTFIVAQDQEFDAGRGPGAKHRRDQPADFWWFRYQGKAAQISGLQVMRQFR